MTEYTRWERIGRGRLEALKSFGNLARSEYQDKEAINKRIEEMPNQQGKDMWSIAFDFLEREGWFEFYEEHEIPIPIADLAQEVGLFWHSIAESREELDDACER